MAMPATPGAASGPSLHASGLTGSLETGWKTGPELGAAEAEGVAGLVTLAASATTSLPPLAIGTVVGTVTTLPDGYCCP